MENENNNDHNEVSDFVETVEKRVNGYLHKIVPVTDHVGKVINYALSPIMVEFRPRDLMQVIVGASILAVPVALTEETWKLGETLGFYNIYGLCMISLLFISLFVYFNFYRYVFEKHLGQYVKRVLSIYIFSLLVVGVILTLIDKCPWNENFWLAVKRIIIVTFPASMSAAVSDSIK
jgi:uncharacterized membrane protein